MFRSLSHTPGPLPELGRNRRCDRIPAATGLNGLGRPSASPHRAGDERCRGSLRAGAKARGAQPGRVSDPPPPTPHRPPNCRPRPNHREPGRSPGTGPGRAGSCACAEPRPGQAPPRRKAPRCRADYLRRSLRPLALSARRAALRRGDAETWRARYRPAVGLRRRAAESPRGLRASGSGLGAAVCRALRQRQAADWVRFPSRERPGSDLPPAGSSRCARRCEHMLG